MNNELYTVVQCYWLIVTSLPCLSLLSYSYVLSTIRLRIQPSSPPPTHPSNHLFRQPNQSPPPGSAGIMQGHGRGNIFTSLNPFFLGTNDEGLAVLHLCFSKDASIFLWWDFFCWWIRFSKQVTSDYFRGQFWLFSLILALHFFFMVCTKLYIVIHSISIFWFYSFKCRLKLITTLSRKVYVILMFSIYNQWYVRGILGPFQKKMKRSLFYFTHLRNMK